MAPAAQIHMFSSGTKLQVELLGEMYEAEVQAAPLYDANGANMRM